MKNPNLQIAALLLGVSTFGASTLATPAWAGVSADEAKQLGATLTPLGGEVAANKEGTIPAYTGGLKALPAGVKP